MPSAVAVLSKLRPSSARKFVAGASVVPSRSRTVLLYSVLLSRWIPTRPGSMPWVTTPVLPPPPPLAPVPAAPLLSLEVGAGAPVPHADAAMANTARHPVVALRFQRLLIFRLRDEADLADTNAFRVRYLDPRAFSGSRAALMSPNRPGAPTALFARA